MSDVNANIRISADVKSARLAIKGLVQELNAFNAAANPSNLKQLAGIRNITNDIARAASESQFLRSEFVKLTSGAQLLDKTLAKGKGTLGQFFSARFNKDGFQAAQVLDLANERARILGTTYMQTGKQARNFQEALAIGPTNAFNRASQIASQQQLILSNMLRQGTTHMINFGKNTQWAGRQLMVGFTVPLTILGTTASKVFMELEQQAVYFKRVYGDIFTTTEETQRNLESINELAKGFTRYGVAVKDTLALAGQVAAAGRTDVELRDATIQATRLAVLGQMEQNTALKATIALQSAFRIGGNELAQTIDFLNAVENQTVVSLEDISAAIPRVAPVIKGLGGDVKDLTVFLAAMQEGGVSAEQGANALKSGLASLINPTKAASETLSGFNINLEQIIAQNRGDLMGTVTAFGKALQNLDMFSRQQALEKVFGKYQYARLGALFENIGREGSQAAQVMDLMGYSTSQLAALSQRELSRIEESFSVKLKAAIEEFKLAIAPIGEIFVRVATPIIKFGTKMAEMFNNLPEGAKKIITFVTLMVGIVVPAILMFGGLLFNLVGQLIRFGQTFALLGKGMVKGGLPSAISLISERTKYLNLDMLASSTAIDEFRVSTDLSSTALKRQRENINFVITDLDRLIQKLILAFDAQTQLNAATGKKMSPGIAARSAAKKPPIRRAGGGKVPGVGTQDTIPALLTPGEFVINKEASQKYAPFLSQINKGAVGQFATGLNASYTKDDVKRGYTMFTDSKGAVRFRQISTGRLASEAQAIKQQAIAARAAQKMTEQTKIATNRMAAFSGKLSVASGAVGTVALGAAMMSGGQNELLNKFMIGAIAFSALSTMVVGMKSGIAVAAAIAIGSLYAIHKSNEAQIKKGVELGNAMTLTAKSIASMGDYFGNKTNYQIQMDKISAGQSNVNEVLTEGKNFLQSEQGKLFVKEVQSIQQLTKGNFASTRDAVATKLAQAVTSGIMSQDQAQSISYALGQELKNTELGFSIAARLTSIVGPNGEDLSTKPMEVALTLNTMAEKQIELARTRVSELGGELNKISAFWSSSADEARRSIGLLTALQNSALVTQRENIANVVAGYDQMIEKMKQAGDLSGADLLEKEKIKNIESLQAILDKQRKELFEEFIPDAKILTKFSPAQEVFSNLQKQSFKALGDSIESLYKNNPYVQQFLNLTEKETAANANLRISVNAGTIDPQIASLIAGQMETTEGGRTAYNRIFNMDFKAIGEKAALQLGQAYLSMDESQRKQFEILIATRGGEEASKIAPLLLKVANIPSLISVVLSINTQGVTEDELQRYNDGINAINSMPDVIGKEVALQGIDKQDILEIDELNDKMQALATVDEKYNFVVESEVIGLDDMDKFKLMWDAISGDPVKVAKFMASFSVVSTEIDDLQERIALLRQGGTTFFEAQDIAGYEDRIEDLGKTLVGTGKVLQDYNSTEKEGGDEERKVSALEYLKALMELKLRGLDPARAATLDQLEAVQLSELATKAQIKAIEKLNEEQRIAAMTTEILKDENQRLADTLNTSSSAIDTQIQMLERNSIKPIQDSIDAYKKSLDSISKKEDQVNKIYDERLKALKAVEQQNQRNAEQQKNQIDLASALTSGDIASAAKAASNITSTAAGYALQDTEVALEESKQQEISNITEQINGKLLTRIQIEKEIEAQQLKLVDFEKQKVALTEKQFKLQTVSSLMGTIGQLRNTANATQRNVLMGQAQNFGSILGVSNIQAGGAFNALSSELGIDLSGIGAEFTSAIQTSQKSITELATHSTSVAKSVELSSKLYKKAETEASNSLSFMSGISNLWGDKNKGLAATGADIYASLKSARDEIRQGISDIAKAKNDAISAINNAKGKKFTGQTAMYGGSIKKYAFGGMVNYRGSTEPAPGMMYGGQMKKYALGSEVPGIGMIDKVPALLTPGEFVVRKSAAQANLPLLNAINENVFPKTFDAQSSGVGIVSQQNTNTIMSAPVYNYSVNVNVADTNASANEIAGVVMNKIRMTQDKTIRGNRY